ncbi:MAG: isoprenylcysteine carboxylmethyltransferase family protein [Acidobacteria bacterium]|nr:isoprenylcysteine carboxylmethyltransferase family protein [Acidobacteriota bacterium]
MNDTDSLGLAPDLASDATVPRLVQGSGAEAQAIAPPRPEPRHRFGPLSRRLADQGLFLFQHRGLFVVFLLPPALLAVLERRSAALPQDPGLGWLAACLAVSLVGMAVRAAAVGSAPPGASTRSLRAPSASRLNTSGMYSLSRHPVYLGNLFVLLGFALAVRSWWFVLTAALVYWLLYERVIAAEERFLVQRFGVAHRRWAERTPTFWPRPHLWRPSETRFSWRTVLLREYNSFLLIAAILVFLRWVDQVIVRELAAGVWFRQDLPLTASVLALAVVVAVMRRIRKRGRSGH